MNDYNQKFEFDTKRQDAYGIGIVKYNEPIRDNEPIVDMDLVLQLICKILLDFIYWIC